MSRRGYGKAGNAALRARWAALQSKKAKGASAESKAREWAHLSLFSGIGGLAPTNANEETNGVILRGE